MYVSISFEADGFDYFEPYRQVGTDALSSLGRGMEAFSKQAQAQTAQAAAHMWRCPDCCEHVWVS